MSKKSWLLLIGLFFIACPCYGHCILETEHFVFSMDTYLRTDLVSFKNVVDLDSKNSDDTTTYLGIDYNLGFHLTAKNDGPKFYLKLERNGPFDYDAPLFVHNTLMTAGGVIEKYRNDELLPNLEEFWLDAPLGNILRFKAGLYTYAVGNGFSLNGGYENYGLTVSGEGANFLWRLYYCRPDLVYKNHLGPRIRQEEEQEIDYEPNAANFFAADVKFNQGKNSFQPYLGVLTDYTCPDKRDNVFSAPIKRDILGTFGLAASLQQDKLSLKVEMAHNFGKAASSNPEYKDVYHTGYLIYTGLEYQLEKFIPSFQLLACSGNKVTTEMAQNLDETLTSGKNRAFSYCSPLNKNLGDSISSSNVDMLPIVAMGGGYGINYGLPRPKTFAAGDFENLLMPCLGFDFQATEKLCFGLYGYYLSSFEKGVGMNNSEAKYLSRDLGHELDFFMDYKFSQNILISFLGGYFFPGRYYKEERDNTDESILSPFVRGDTEADPAYQVELAVEFQF